MRWTTLFLAGAIAFALTAVVLDDSDPPGDAQGVPETSADQAPASQSGGATMQVPDNSASAPSSRIKTLPVDTSRFQATQGRGGFDQPSGFVILDPDEPEERIDIGEIREVDELEPQTPETERFIGLPADADDPDADPLTQSLDDPMDIGEPMDPDAIEAPEDVQSFPEPLLIGEARDADPEDDALWQTQQRTGQPVQDIGEPMPLPDPDSDASLLFFDQPTP